MQALSHTAALGLSVLAVGSAQAAPKPLEWLETPKDPSALAWAKEQSDATRKALSARPEFAAVTRELGEALKASPPPPAYALLGDKAMRLERSAAHPHGLLQIAMRGPDGVPGAWRTVLDVDALRAAEGKPFELHWYPSGARNLCLPPAYDRCILQLSPGGSDEEELREFDLAKAAFVADGYHTAAARVQAAWLSPDRLLIASGLSAGRTAAGWPSDVQLWTRGTPLASAPVVARALPSDAIVQLSAIGVGAIRQGVITRAIDYSTFELKLVDQSGAVIPVDMPQKLKPFGVLAATDRHLVVQLAQDAVIAGKSVPAEALVAYDVGAEPPASGRASVVYAPGADDVINDSFAGVAATATRIEFIVDHHLNKRLVSAAPAADGWTLSAVMAGAPGGSLTLADGDPAGEDVILGEAGFITPDRLELLRPGQPARELYAAAPAFDASGLTIDIRTAKSADGTAIDYYLLRPTYPAHPGATPTLMTGYGAFGVSLAPGYLDYTVGGPALKLWLARGGALALPIIRGGGERGEAWHLAAIREKRQRSYDDFIAVAQDLEKTGFTSPSHLGVFGSSNGGLLSAVVSVERPDLFGAVVSDVPLIDMLRFPLMGMGGAWTGEYGDPKDPAAAAVLRTYSPLQNIKDGVRYPPYFITVSTTDNRVGPGHARKFAARLHEIGATAYYYEDQEGGHGVSDALDRPDLMSLRMTFLIDTLMR